MSDRKFSKDEAIRERLSRVPLLSALDEASLTELGRELKWVFVPGGQTLFRQNEVADALYIVMTGCLGVIIRDSNGRDALVSRIVAGETVGEMGLLDGCRRSATVEALRDTELLRVDKSSYERLIEQHPESMLGLISLLVRRLRNTTSHVGGHVPVRTVAILPLDFVADYRQVARELVDQLARDGERGLLLDQKSAGGTPEWFSASEAANDLILYCAEPINSEWTKFCLRQADRVLLIASSGTPFAVPPWFTDEGRKIRRPLELVVLHDRQQRARQTLEREQERLSLELICHVRSGNRNDIARLARLLRGRAIELVLSAGGARGFAHLGVVRALREAHIPIDLIGGCSMGAIVGAAVALEWDDAEIRERLRSAFVESNPLNDYTLPFFSLVKGNKVARRLEQHFGCIRIEDLWRPFFCVSTNLTAGSLTVHREGPLAQALRASLSIPGILPPVMIGRDVHVDGGVMNWLPVDVNRDKRGAVIAVDVASDPALLSFGESSGTQFWQYLRRRRKFPPIIDLLLRAATLSSDALGRRAHVQADVLFKPALESVDLLDWQACDKVIDAGYHYAIKKLEHLGKANIPHQS
jgi:NTE family protein